jgi:hypothetical protein
MASKPPEDTLAPIFGPTPGTSYITPRPGRLPSEDTPDWADQMLDAVELQPFWQSIMALDEQVTPSVEGFDPYSPENIAGYEAYAEDFVGVDSPRELTSLKQRISENLIRRENSEKLGLGSLLLTEVANPINYIPLPGLLGLGAGKGAVVGAISGLGLNTMEEVARIGADPTTNAEENAANIVFGGLFNGILGGGLGMIGAKQRIRMGREYNMSWSRIERAEQYGDEGAGDLEPGTSNFADTGEFEVLPTGEQDVGVASAGGLEKTTQITLHGRLKAMGFGAVEDMADALWGDFGTLSAKNRQGRATQSSVNLAAAQWKGLGADVVSSINRQFALYRKGGEGAEVAGVDINTLGSRSAEAFGKRPADGKMTYKEFNDAVFRSQKADGTIKSDNPFVVEAAKESRRIFDEAFKDGTLTGLIDSDAGRKRTLQMKLRNARTNLARYDELMAKENPTSNDLVTVGYA